MAPTPTLATPATAVVTALVVAGVASALSVAGHQDVTRARVQDSLTTAFTDLYIQQQDELGHPGLTPAAVHATTTCDRGGPAVPDVGAGSDWICMVDWAGQPKPGKFELQVHSSSCFTASGPASIIGSFTITTPAGRTLTNPLSAFDVCFDPDSRAA